MPSIWTAVPLPSGMMAPSPNCFSIWASVFFRSGIRVEQPDGRLSLLGGFGGFFGHAIVRFRGGDHGTAFLVLEERPAVLARGSERPQVPQQRTSERMYILSAFGGFCKSRPGRNLLAILLPRQQHLSKRAERLASGFVGQRPGYPTRRQPNASGPPY